MSRVSLIEQLYTPKKKSALEFDYDKLWAPPIRCLLSQQDIDQLYKIATSLKYNGDIEKKYELIDAVMKPRGFRRGNRGTNRVVYNFLEDTSFCMKIALDRVGIKDSPAEYKNQEFFKPFCCKIFEVDPTGVIACVERVNPISSLEEFMSISDDVYNMMVTKIIGKYVVDDLGTEKFMNYGIRYNSNGVAFGPVVIDFPYAYELDGAKLRCGKPIKTPLGEIPCGGEIDYDAGMNNLVCSKCGRNYTAKELSKDDSNVLKFYSGDNELIKKTMRARIVRESDGTILYDSGRSSNIYVTKEEYEEGNRLFSVDSLEPRKVIKNIKKNQAPLKQLRREYYTELQLKAHEEMEKRNAELFNPVIKSNNGPRPAKRAKSNRNSFERIDTVKDEVISLEPTVAKRAENEFKEETYVLDESVTEPEAIDNSQEVNSEVNEVESSDNLPEEDSDANTDNETHSEEFSEEMEKEAFPEINNQQMIIGVDMNHINDESLEPDYSDYIPPEEDEDEDDDYEDEEDKYSEYFKNERKSDKKNNKPRRGRYVDNDMSDY